MQLAVNRTYATAGGHRVFVLAEVSSDHVRSPYYRAQFLGTGEVVFYLANGNIVSEKPGQSDAKYAIVRTVQ